MDVRRAVWRALMVGVVLAMVAVVAATLPPGVARAATTWTVNSIADNGPGNCTTTCTLRDAVASAAAGDTIQFSLAGTITLTSGVIVISHDLTIAGPGARALTVSGNHASEIFDVGSGATVTISGLTLADGRVPASNANGGAILNSGTLNVADSTFVGNTAGQFGGAIYSTSTSTAVNVADSTFVGNTAGNYGQAIFSWAPLNIAASTFTKNGENSQFEAVAGAGGHLDIVNSTFSGDVSNLAFYGINGTPVTLANSIVSGETCGPTGTAYNNLAPGCPGNLGAVTGLNTTLANNGGPTDTFNLIQPSNAIDAASSCTYPAAFTAAVFDATKDQRGLARPIGTACDIGAVEAMQFTPTSLPNGTYGTYYGQTVVVSAGGSGFNGYIETGTLPTGMHELAGYDLFGTPTQTGTFPITITATDSNGFVGEAAYTLTINPAGTSTSPGNATATFSTSDQSVTLSATVRSPGVTVNEGTVTFTVTDDTNTVVGTPTTSGNVSNGSASASFTLPSGTPIGSYTITAAYHDAAGNFAGSTGTSTLTISSAGTTTKAQPATAEDVASSVTLAATVTSGASAADEGTVTFTVTDGKGNLVGTASTPQPVSNVSGTASVSYPLPGTLVPAGTYTITAAYHDAAGNFADSTGTSSLTITPGPPATVSFSPGNTSSTVGTGVTETVTVKDAAGNLVSDGTPVSWAITGPTSGTASISHEDTTTTNGQATLVYTNTKTGTDTVGATAGTSPNTASGSAQVTWTPGPAATLTLAPGNVTGTVGTPVTETATVEDAYGNPVADGTAVGFTVTGPNASSGTVDTAGGQAAFSDAGLLPGTDTLVASVSGTALSQTATIGWVLPASTPNATLGVANFTTPYVYGAAQTAASGGPRGLLDWRSPQVSFLTEHETTLVVSGPDATLFGTATLSTGQSVEFRLDAVAGIGGTVRLRLSDGYDSGVVHVLSVRVTP